MSALHGIVDQPYKAGVIWQPFAEEFEATEDGHKQIVEIVRDTAGQIADRFDLLRLLQGMFGADSAVISTASGTSATTLPCSSVAGRMENS